MDQNHSNVLDDHDEFGLDDKDEFFKDVQRLFYSRKLDASLGVVILQNQGYNVTLIKEEETPFSPVTWVVEGRR